MSGSKQAKGQVKGQAKGKAAIKVYGHRTVQAMRAENGRDSKGRPQLVYCINEKQQNRVTLPSVSRFFP